MAWQIPTYNQTVTVNNLGNIAPVQSVNVGAPVASGLSQLGQGLVQGSQLAGQVDQMQVQQENEVAQIDAFKQTSTAQVEIAKQWQEMQRTATGAGTGLTDGIVKSIQEKQKQLLSTNTNHIAQKIIDHDFTKLQEQYAMNGMQAENQMFTNYKINGLSDTTKQLSDTVYQDPSQFVTSLAKSKTAIMGSGLPEDVQIKLIKQSENDLQDAYLNNMITTNPEQLVNMTKPVLGQLPAGSVSGQIAELAQKQGVDPVYALATGGIESGNVTGLKSKTSSAAGIFQQLKTNPNAPVSEQFTNFAQLTKSNQAQLRMTLNREPNNKELYLAHHFGATGATELLQADPNAKINTVVSEAVMKANPYLKGKSVQQVIDINNNKFGKESNKYIDQEKEAVKDSSPISLIPAEKLARWMPKAENAVETRQQQTAINLSGQVKDHETMFMDGKLPNQLMTPEQFNMMYPKDPEKARQAYAQYDTMKNTGMALNRMSQQTPQQRMETLQALKPTGEQDYAIKSQAYNTALQANMQMEKNIQDDPARWAINNNPTVRGEGDFDGIIAAQRLQGVQSPSLLTKAKEQSIISSLTNMQGNDMIKSIDQIKQQYGNKFGLVGSQLLRNKELPQGFASILTAPDDGGYAAQWAAKMSKVDMKQLEAALPNTTDKKDVDEALRAVLQPFNNSIPAGMQSSQIQDIQSTITKVAYEQRRAGKTVNEAAEFASNLFLGENKYSYLDNKATNYKLRVPKKYDPDLVETNMQSISKNLTANDVDLRNAKPLQSPWGMEDNTDSYLSQIKNNSYWLTNADETGANLYFLGADNRPYPVRDNKGAQISKTFTELSTPQEPSGFSKLIKKVF